jgi:Tfp pilus assembly protein PilX
MGVPATSLSRLLPSSNERGSILLITIVSVAVVALLGLAVYDLALIEAQYSAASVVDYRAYEIAQAGIERGIRELRNLYMSYPPGQETFVGGSTTCAPTPCNTTQFHLANVMNATVPPQTIAAGPFAGAVDPGGTYTLEVKYLTVAEANNSVAAVSLTYPSGIQCFPDNVFTSWCANLAFLRSTGTATDGAGNTRTRTIQTLVRASSTSPWAGGIVAGGGNPAVSGQVLIGGSVHILGGFTANPALDIGGGGNAGMVNSWFPLSSSSGYSQSEAGDESLIRLTPKQLICPPSTNCAGGANLVESLAAEIKIFGNVSNQMVNVGGGTSLGQSGPTASYGTPARNGKGGLDGVHISQGCALPCMGGAPQPFSSGASVIVDRGNVTKPYPNNPPTGPLLAPGNAWPILDDVVTISNNVAGTDYRHFYNDWFNPNVSSGTNSANFSSSTVPNGGKCVAPTDDECVGKSGPNTFNDLFNKLTANTKSFRHSFKFTDRRGIQRDAEICWRRDTMSGGPSGNQGPNPPLLPYTLEFGIYVDGTGPQGCAQPSGPGNATAPFIPVMFWYGNPWGIDHPGGPQVDISFRGWGLMLTNATVFIDQNFVPYCTNPGVSPPCGPVYPAAGWQGGNKFPENHLFATMTTNGVMLATVRNNVSRIFGYFWAMGNIGVQRDVNVVGMLRGSNVCFRNSSGCGGIGGGGSIPGFFQASFLDHRKIPNELAAPYEVPGQLSGGRWQVTSVPQFWIECRRGPVDTLPPTPSGICGYQ